MIQQSSNSSENLDKAGELGELLDNQMAHLDESQKSKVLMFLNGNLSLRDVQSDPVVREVVNDFREWLQTDW